MTQKRKNEVLRTPEGWIIDEYTDENLNRESIMRSMWREPMSHPKQYNRCVW